MTLMISAQTVFWVEFYQFNYCSNSQRIQLKNQKHVK
jgi:hypothetical protein